jgi:hypothetical protein
MSLTNRFRKGMEVLLDGQPSRIVQLSPGLNYVHVSAGAGAIALSEAEARKRVLAPGEDPVLVKLTDRERELYVRVKHGNCFCVTGADIRTARRLAKIGLIKIIHDTTVPGQWQVTFIPREK